jgi:hypothetical protein
MPEPSDFLQQAACYYFPQTAADETGQCLDLQSGLLDWIFAATWDVPQVRDVIGAYRDVLDVNLARPSSSYSRSNNKFPPQAVQAGLDLVLAHFLEKIAGESVECLSFSGAGAQAAYIFADIVSVRDYLGSAVSTAGANPRILNTTAIPNRVTHFPLHSRSEMLQDVAFHPARFAIIDSSGEAVEAGSDDFSTLRRFYEDSITGVPAATMNGPGKRAKRLIIVSTRAGAAVLNGAGGSCNVARAEDIALPLAVLV